MALTAQPAPPTRSALGEGPQPLAPPLPERAERPLGVPPSSGGTGPRTSVTMSRRLAMELEEVRRWGGVRDLHLVDRDVLRWRGLLLPNNPPYNAGAFRFELAFSPHHPLVPPRVKLLTSIHHPGVGCDGTVCQPLTSPEKWEPITCATHVLQDLLLLLDNPSTERVLRPELARELSERPEAFLHQAEEHTRRYAEPRPHTSGP